MTEIKKPYQIKDITGQRFGRLTVLEFDHIHEYRHPYHETMKNRIAFWKTRCDCGREKVVNGSLLRQGKLRSCGCLVKEVNKLNWEKRRQARREGEVSQYGL